MRNFRQMLENRWSLGTMICVGLDSDPNQIPKSVLNCGTRNDVEESYINKVVAFNRAIVEATHDLVCAYKPNSAFYEAHGAPGMAALAQTISDIHVIAPNVPVILDAKRADIGDTNTGYAKAAFDYLKADAITVHPYLGSEALRPFLAQADKGIIVLCRTSNKGAGEFQDLSVNNGEPLYRFVARSVASEQWNKNRNCALVVGATYPKELGEVRKIVGDMPILIPGFGKQGGKADEVVPAGMDSRGYGMIINSSSGIIFASKDEDFAVKARYQTELLRNTINQYR